MIKEYWKLEKIEEERRCEICGRKLTHRFVGVWDENLFGRWDAQVEEWEKEGIVATRDGNICVKCEM